MFLVDPPNTAALGTGEKTAVLENGGKGSHITKKKHIGELKISSDIGGKRSTEGRYWGGGVTVIIISNIF